MPGTQYPSILAGQGFTAGLLLSMLEWTAWKSADTSRASTTTLTADPDLQFTVPAAGTYRLEGYWDYEGNTGGSGDLQFSLNSVGTLRYQIFGQTTAGALSGIGTRVGGTTYVLGSAGAGVLCGANIRGMLTTPASGSLVLNWAQNTLSTTATIMHALSWMTLRRVA